MNACLRHLSRALAWALSCALLASCQSGPRAPTIRLEQVAQMAPGLPGATPRWQQAEPAEAGVRVFRQGQPMVASRGMLLQAGDVVETGPRSGATVRFSGATGGTVTLDENTRARVGSIEVFFGRVFASVRGFFEASSAGVVAGVEGTQFLFEVAPDRSTHVAVAEGVVNCRARDGEWRDLRLRANEALRSVYPSTMRPQAAAADVRELRGAAFRASQINDAEPTGWCCANGSVRAATRSQCNGLFATTRAEAERTCAPRSGLPPAPYGPVVR